jgi:Holliday junction resolvase
MHWEILKIPGIHKEASRLSTGEGWVLQAKRFKQWTGLIIMRTYRKGSRAERELIDYFSQRGFCVIRAAGSGVNSLSPDILVFRRGMQIGIEAKAWEKENLNIDRDQFMNLTTWEDVSGINCFVGWRRNRKGWAFVPLPLFRESEKSFGINWDNAQALGKKLEEFD